MSHLISKEDLAFKTHVESCKFPVSEFHHNEHLQLAYVYLAEYRIDGTATRMRHTLHNLLIHAGITPSQKYHETLTRAWILAVHHFMKITEQSNSATDFINQNPTMLNSKIMHTHYSAEVLFSEDARKSFIEPNLDPIPKYEG